MLQHPKGVAIRAEWRDGRNSGPSATIRALTRSPQSLTTYARPRLGSTAAQVVQGSPSAGPSSLREEWTTKIAGHGQLGYMEEAAGVQENKGAS